MTIGEWQRYINDWAVRKGWRLPGEKADPDGKLSKEVMNIVCEVAEAWEEIRGNHAPDEVYYKPSTEVGGQPKPEGFPIELADAVIRIMDTAYVCGIDLEAAIETKMAYNEKRPFRHGGKRS